MSAIVLFSQIYKVENISFKYFRDELIKNIYVLCISAFLKQDFYVNQMIDCLLMLSV